MPCPTFGALRCASWVCKAHSALGKGPVASQVFTLINQSQFAFPKSDGFVDFVAAAATGKWYLAEVSV